MSAGSNLGALQCKAWASMANLRAQAATAEANGGLDDALDWTPGHDPPDSIEEKWASRATSSLSNCTRNT